MAKQPRIKHRAKVTITDSHGRQYQSGWQGDIHEAYDMLTRGVFLWGVPVPKKVGAVQTFVVRVEYLGEKQYRQTYQQRAKAMATAEKRREAWQKEQARLKLERDEKELVQRRNRIMNQIELAFVKEGRDAISFVTCDECDGMATHLGLAYENPGSQVIDPDQITGAWCGEHDNKYARPYKTTVAIACNKLEFFYDGLRQISIKPGA